MTQPVAALCIGSVIERWTERANEWKKLDVSVKGAPLAEEIIADLEAIAAGTNSEELTVTQAAEATGYTADHIGRLVREGKLTNYGRKGAPRVRRSELPKRINAVAVRNRKPYNVRSDARSLGVRR